MARKIVTVLPGLLTAFVGATAISAATLDVSFTGHVTGFTETGGGLRDPVQEVFAGAQVSGYFRYETDAQDTVSDPGHAAYIDAVGPLVLSIGGYDIASATGTATIRTEPGYYALSFVSTAIADGLTGDAVAGNSVMQFRLTFREIDQAAPLPDVLPGVAAAMAPGLGEGSVGYHGVSVCWSPGPGAEVCNYGTQFVGFSLDTLNSGPAAPVPLPGGLTLMLAGLGGLRLLARTRR